MKNEKNIKHVDELRYAKGIDLKLSGEAFRLSMAGVTCL